ncbi:MAG: response regulator [Actinobacteria bacterium]|nr:MAG: response regulator [Actinomycetota bacterium]
MAKQILIVDDAAFMRMMIRDILTKDGYVIHEATNGQEAVTKYQEINPDLVTMDITMPDVDGIEALKRIRDADPSAKVLMVSAMGQQKLILEALEAGASDFIVKPFQPTKVLEIVHKALNDS